MLKGFYVACFLVYPTYVYFNFEKYKPTQEYQNKIHDKVVSDTLISKAKS